MYVKMVSILSNVTSKTANKSDHSRPHSTEGVHSPHLGPQVSRYVSSTLDKDREERHAYGLAI